jgi:hypothetical protein
MTNPIDDNIRSGASHVDETEQLASGLSDPRQNAQEEIEDPTRKTALADLTLSMFTQGSSIRVRVGNVHNSSEFYESSFDSADAANNAMLDAGILTKAQVRNLSQPAGTGIPVSGITVEQLVRSGLKRHGTSTL